MTATILTNLSGTQRQRFEEALLTLCEAEKEGAMANARHKELKTALSRAFERVQDAIRRKHVLVGAAREVFYDLELLPTPATISRSSKVLAKTDVDHPAIDELRAFVDEADAISERFKAIVPVKKQPKPQVDRYIAPQASSDAQRKVQDILETIVVDNYVRLVEMFFEGYRRIVDRYEAARVENPKTNAYDFSMIGHGYLRRSDPIIRGVLEMATDHFGNVRDDASDILRKNAEKEAKAIRDVFVVRNRNKLDTIIERKVLVRARTIRSGVSLAGLEGEIRFDFADGSRFETKMQVVGAVSPRGKPFHRAPITFHNVVLSDGSRMVKPSEKKMNEMF